MGEEIDISDLKKKPFPKILLFDIETLPMEVYVWGLYKQRISPESVKKEWSIACWAAKWLGDSEIMGKSVAKNEAVDRLDNSVLQDIWYLFDKADIVVAHNGDRFDIIRLNFRWSLNGFSPPSHYRSIDTCKQSRKLFASSSHKLDYLNKQFGLTRKIDTQYKLWLDCINPDTNGESLEEMLVYCKGDIMALEDLYIKIRPWIKSHPPCGAFISAEDEVCPNCCSDNLGYSTTDYVTPAGRYVGIRCQSCGAIGRMMSNQMDIRSRRKLIRSVAR